jgi:aminopeptidase N
MQLNLTNWYPFVVPFINGDWVLHDPWYYGEHLVYDAADFDVTLAFADPINAPFVASSGAPEGAGQATRYTLTAGRAFVFSMSHQFKVGVRQFGEVAVTSYYFPFNDDGSEAALNAVGQALQTYSQHYGPYPHKSLAVVMGDFNDGMEYSAFFYLSRDFYNLYKGNTSAVNYLIFVAAHETAHQWWFEQVGNDQAEQPWLDEALATYSERLFYEAAYPDLVANWWSYRVDFYQPQGFVDIPIYEGQGFRPYTNAVYFRGAHFLEDLRARLGDPIFFAFLQDYLNQEKGKIATPADFFAILAQHTQADYSDIVRQYFQNLY